MTKKDGNNMGATKEAATGLKKRRNNGEALSVYQHMMVYSNPRERYYAIFGMNGIIIENRDLKVRLLDRFVKCTFKRLQREGTGRTSGSLEMINNWVRPLVRGR